MSQSLAAAAVVVSGRGRWGQALLRMWESFCLRQGSCRPGEEERVSVCFRRGSSGGSGATGHCIALDRTFRSTHMNSWKYFGWPLKGPLEISHINS